MFPFIKNLHHDGESAYARYMGDAIFKIPTAAMLSKIADGIDRLELGEEDSKGDLYEYLLSKVATAGTNGQFRTPRHIIRMMVALVKPQPDDIIIDPAMGSAGFLIEAQEYLRKNHAELFLNAELREHFNREMFYGNDINPPFKGSLDYEAVSADLLRVTKTKKTELLFLALFLRILKKAGEPQ